MSVLEVNEIHIGSDVRDGQNESTDSRTYDVLLTDVTNATVARNQAIFASTIPRVGDPHPVDVWQYVRDVSAVSRGSIYNWDVTVYYSSQATDRNRIDNPLQVPTQVAFGSVSSIEPIDRDINGDPITNSSGETFDPPITREFHDTLITITRNQSEYDELVASEYRGTINSDPFLVYSSGMCKVNGINANRERLGNYDYFRVTYEIQVRYDGWKRRVLDEGYRTITSIDDDGYTTFANITDSEGNAISQPHLLDGDGDKLKDGATAAFLEFDIYRALSFSALDLEKEFI